jgi:hypothetical protein
VVARGGLRGRRAVARGAIDGEVVAWESRGAKKTPGDEPEALANWGRFTGPERSYFERGAICRTTRAAVVERVKVEGPVGFGLL